MTDIEYTVAFEAGPWDGKELELPYYYMDEGDIVGVISHHLSPFGMVVEGRYEIVELHGFCGIAIWIPNQGFLLPPSYVHVTLNDNNDKDAGCAFRVPNPL